MPNTNTLRALNFIETLKTNWSCCQFTPILALTAHPTLYIWWFTQSLSSDTLSGMVEYANTDHVLKRWSHGKDTDPATESLCLCHSQWWYITLQIIRPCCQNTLQYKSQTLQAPMSQNLLGSLLGHKFADPDSSDQLWLHCTDSVLRTRH